MTKELVLAAALCWSLFAPALAQYDAWQHRGSWWILTTPEGADLPARCSEVDFPLLVRLDRGTFDFGQAKAHGEDIRFIDDRGTPLAYQIEQWDAVRGTAAVWVRIPAVKGNARQEIRMYWGKADATSESRGSAVFGESNGYLSVLHLGDPVEDEVGTLSPVDAGTTACAGVIGNGRHFDVGKGIKCGENIAHYPTGGRAHTSQAWFRAEQPNALVLGWGNEQAQGKVTMQVASPPHVRMDCYFSDANVAGSSVLPMRQWVHVVHTYDNGNSRLYVNGRLDGTATRAGTPLAIRSPARMWIGGWYNDYRFVGEIDELRISKVARSADWVKLEYENQKAQQTLVGSLVQPGSAFSVSCDKIDVLEGRSVTITAQAGGAQKNYWILKRAGTETVVAVDQLSYTFDAGRVVGDQSPTLRFKAIYANEIKTKDIPITIHEDIPEPVFTLKAPATWDGRATIEVVPQIANQAEMNAKGAGTLNCDWTVSGIAVIKAVVPASWHQRFVPGTSGFAAITEASPGKLILNRAQNSGKLTVSVAIDNGGAKTARIATIQVKEPRKDAWVQRAPEKDEKPEDNQFYARDDKNEGTLYCQGTLAEAADTVSLRVYADDKVVKNESRQLAADRTYAFAVKLKPRLIKYRVELRSKTGTSETVVHAATNLVCGDAFLIDGQSNALATDTGEEAPRYTSDWIRSYGRPPTDPQAAPLNLWCNPVWKARPGDKAELGYWGMELAKRLVESQRVPVFIINGAVGGTRIDQHQRNEANPTDLNTMYGRTLWRAQHARLTHGIRAVLWHQGENDQGADGPTGRYGWETYQQYFVDVSAAWKRDYPNVQNYYVFQIWPNACSMGGRQGSGDMLREVQRTLPRLYSNMGIMSTLGIKPPGPCHYPLAGWAEFARLIQPLIERDHYGKASTVAITPPNLRRACYTSNRRDAIALEFDQPVAWRDSLANQFYLDEAAEKVASGAVSGSVLTLQLKEASTARKITYLKETAWGQEKLLFGANGIAALTFCNVSILSP
jgi:hypothetical protein